MLRSYLLVVLSSCLFVFPAQAADYTLVFEAVETIGEERKTQTLEVLVRPDAPFGAKGTFDKHSLEVEGTLKPETDGKFLLQLALTQSIDDGIVIPVKGGGKPVPHTMSAATSLRIKVGESFVVGKVVTTEQTPGQEPQKTQRQTTARLKLREAAAK